MSVTLAVMARAPLEGRCKTRLAASLGAAWATRLYEAMLLDTLERFGRLPVDRHVVLAAPEDQGVALLEALVPAPWQVVAQEGEGLGERLREAVPGRAAPRAREPRELRGARRGRRSDLLLQVVVEARPSHARPVRAERKAW